MHAQRRPVSASTTCNWVGMKPAPDVVVHVSAIVNFTNVTAMHIANLMIEGRPHSIFSVDNCYNGTSVRLLSEISGFMLMTISATTFVGVCTLSQYLNT